jgi:hypothetical protein
MRIGAEILLCLLLASDALAARERGRGRARSPAVTASPLIYSQTLNTGDCASGASVAPGVTFARTSAASCVRADGIIVTLAAGNPRLTSLGFVHEGAVTNGVLHSRDLTQAVWTKTGMTCLKDAAGTDGVASSASTCTATAASGTVLQTVSATSTQRSSSFFVKRITGTGTIEVTRDNGTTWTNVTACVDAGTGTGCDISHNGFRRVTNEAFSALCSTLANPTVGVRLATSGDAVAIDGVQDETLCYPSTRVDSTATAGVRQADVSTFTKPTGMSETEGCAQVCMAPLHRAAAYSWQTGVGLSATSGSRFAQFLASSVFSYNGGSSGSVAPAFVYGTSKCYRAEWSVSGNYLRTRNVTAGTLGSSIAHAGFPSFGATLGLGNYSDGTGSVVGVLTAVKIANTPGGCE